MFLFHTGSIKRNVTDTATTAKLSGFYSILVRLKEHGTALLSINVMRVSIPYWFD